MEWDGNIWNWGATLCTFQVCSIFNNKRLVSWEIEVQQLRKETENEEIAPDRVDTVPEIKYGRLIGAETVREQFWDLEDYPEDTTKS